MNLKKVKNISPKTSSVTQGDEDDLKQFVQKKKNQTAALKILIAKLNTK